MIYYNGKRYLRMKNGQPYEEAYSSISIAQFNEIKTYMATHEGETIIAENGEDWIFKFEPFPEKIIQYLKKGGHRLHLRYSYRGKSSMYGIGWLNSNDELLKNISTGDRKSFYKMIIPAVNEWKGNIGYCYIWDSPQRNLEGQYPVAIRVTPQELRRGEIVLPSIVNFHNTRTRTWWLPVIAKLSLVFEPGKIHTHTRNKVEGEMREDLTPIAEAAIMESKTIVTKNRNGLDAYKQQTNPWVIRPNTINAGATRTKTHSITIIRNDLYENEIEGHGWLSFGDGSNSKGTPENDLINFQPDVFVDVNSVKFQIRTTFDCKVRIRSLSMGWDFITLREPVPPTEDHTGASEYITPTIGVTQDIDDLEIIIYD